MRWHYLFAATLLALTIAGFAIGQNRQQKDPASRAEVERLMSGGADLFANHPFAKERAK